MTRALAWGVIPLKDPGSAKQRLAGALSQEEREGLFRAMVRDVLAALHRAALVGGVLLVTNDGQFGELGIQLGMDVMTEPSNDGHTEAVNRGLHAIMARGIDTVFTMPGDIPTVSSAEIDQLLSAHCPAHGPAPASIAAPISADPPAVTIAPAGDELGTNGIVLSPPSAIRLRFGDNSFFLHLNSARAAGIEPTVVTLPGFALDVDHPRDLKAFCATPTDTQAYYYLQSHGILNRLNCSGFNPSGA
ncbi:MAG: NTP transferase domain-containing protein [Gammaproteobacteria bacterium]|nr:NTP transferase domain-containing protein [Gammaproteobacteria bacterium]